MILLSVYCTKTAIDIFTLSFYRLIFLHCLSCVCQLFIKDHDDDDDDDASKSSRNDYSNVLVQ